jgi:hypothetical protein
LGLVNELRVVRFFAHNTLTRQKLMKLLQFKVDNPENETVTDIVAASAYVEQFGLEVFGRAEAAMNANKVTK